MIGKIIDLNVTDALVSFKDGSIADISISHLPYSAKIGDTVNINPDSMFMANDKLKNTSFMNIF
ncbi:hypothetical protein [Clostridium luticellarii]|jgi:hypothetical protein|uniref:Uncharacterized protein n=1 Tax=Clostridium luticellarii TaxID=1691940 RepID=A0A2T0BDZ7_9CLOT|nr:hypothetical protein [Clostridium luticellarii]MCI1944921.1 hypothetical protein [Clostridium luticellarii]MCI1968403.1 hypothetical protein [Clostridium luticellarii]MCI1995401.1 hypothetical protein [Clostridium luticellarii]MCI2039464.1 hypothetical protein [Clostridium luticellarii]PRR82118.1 hypothetical protein CLLU_29320 [Clostridium luticellarii]